MRRSFARKLGTVVAAVALTLSVAGSAFAYEDVHIPPAACNSVLAGITHFHDSPAPEQMQQTPAWGNTSRFVYDRCE